jgi:hypothetical protein
VNRHPGANGRTGVNGNTDTALTGKRGRAHTRWMSTHALHGHTEINGHTHAARAYRG